MTSFEDRVLELAIQIQQIPAPTFDEAERADFVRTLLYDEKLLDVASDAAGNVFGRWPGQNDIVKPVIVCAHLDTVLTPDPRHPTSRDRARVHGIGIGDNALGVASLFALLWSLREAGVQPAADLWLVATVGEEGLGNLRGMREVVDRFGAHVRAYIVIEGTALGQVYHRGLGVRRYRITATTAGGHSWSDHGRPSAIHELAGLITRLTSLPLPDQPRTTLNVGVIAGGQGVNVVAPEAYFELDVRSETSAGLHSIVSQVEKLCHSAGNDDVAIRVDVIGERPAGELPSSHPLVRLAAECLMEQGLTPALTAGSTDANIPLSTGLPAIVIGVTTGMGAHTAQECIDVAPIGKGIRQMAALVERLLLA
jgi:tripeptide aminopeptidase